MTDILIRLLWALPLVVLTGLVIMLILRRVLVLPRAPAIDTQPMSIRQSLVLSEDTRVHVLEIDHQSYVLVESSRHALLQAIRTNELPQRAPRSPPIWLRHVYKSAAG